MARRRKKRTLKPRTPVRIRKRKRARSRGGTQHAELVGLVLAAFGIFLASVLYLGWSGGLVGGGIVDGVRGLLGGAAYATPVAFVGIGGLMLGRSELVDLRPFRTGLVALTLGVELALGTANGGFAGHGLRFVFGSLLGATGATILGSTAIAIGMLLLTGASVGALVQRSGHAVRRAGGAARRRALAQLAPEPAPPPANVTLLRSETKPIDAVHDFPDVIGETLEPSPLLLPEPEHEEEPDALTLFHAGPSETPEYRLPDRGVLRASPPGSGPSTQASARIADALVETLAHFGVDATISGQIAGPRVTRYELQLAPGTKVAKVAALKDDLSYALAPTG